MSGEAKAHAPPDLLPVAVGAAAAFASGALGPVTLLICLAALGVGAGRARGSRLSRFADRPRLFAWLAGLYLPIFAVDLFASAQVDPVAALARLVVFIVVAEVLAGDPSRTHRPVLLGTLLIVVAAAETTELWFALPLAAFVLTAVRARARATLVEALPPERRPRQAPRASGAIAVALGSLLFGAMLFFLLPHYGGGWGGSRELRDAGAGRETGLADEVKLGGFGKIKKRRDVVFHARLTDRDVDPAEIYWRARVYSDWTGRGWRRAPREEDRLVQIPAGRVGPLPSACTDREVQLVAQIELHRPALGALPVPGQALWIRTPRDTLLRVSPTGTIAAAHGRPPRRYDVGISAPCARPGAPADDIPSPASYLSVGLPDPAVRTWARRVAPEERRPDGLARAFVRDLASRPYSLDIRGIDPARPLASFLGGVPAHCEFFATAMALGLRLRGVPARVVGGYLGAETVPLSDRLVVRDERAHLWVEAYVPGRGWVAYDPTPPEGRDPPAGPIMTLKSGWDTAVVLWDTWVIGLDLEDQAVLVDSMRDVLVAAARALLASARRSMLALACAGLLLAAVLLVRRRRRFLRLPVPGFYREFLRLAARRGLVPEPSETAREFASRAGWVLGDVTAVARICALYERVRFGAAEVTREEQEAVRAALRALTARAARPRRPIRRSA